jgi:hypothetical protein
MKKAHHIGIMGTATSNAKRASRASSAKARKKPAANRPAPRRTTITLSPETLEIVERFRSASGTSTSAAINRIIQRSEPKPSRLKENVNGFLVLDVPFRHVNVTLEDVKRAEDEMDREYVERTFLGGKKQTTKESRAGRRK